MEFVYASSRTRMNNNGKDLGELIDLLIRDAIDGSYEVTSKM
jgi:hypothetical protein